MGFKFWIPDSLKVGLSGGTFGFQLLVGLRIPQAKILRSPDSRKEEFRRFRNSLQRVTWIIQFKCSGFWRLKSVRGT